MYVKYLLATAIKEFMVKYNVLTIFHSKLRLSACIGWMTVLCNVFITQICIDNIVIGSET